MSPSEPSLAARLGMTADVKCARCGCTDTVSIDKLDGPCYHEHASNAALGFITCYGILRLHPAPLTAEEAITIDLVDAIRRMLPGTSAQEFLMVRRLLPRMMVTARLGGMRAQLQALEQLEKDVLLMEIGQLPPVPTQTKEDTNVHE